MYGYKLEQHLKNCCIDYPEYSNLYSTWNLNKKTCTDALKTIIINYPHFSMHDSSHAESVLSNMEMILGNRIENLSPTDTWILLHSAYTHDLGMIIKWDEIENLWKSNEFQEHLLSLSTSNDSELREAIEFVQNFIKNKNDITSLLWPLKIYKYVHILNASYFRGLHAHISKKYIDVLGHDLKLDLGHSNLIQPRLLKLLGDICELHTESLDKVFHLDYKTNGFGSDYIHPRFIAMMLRISDLLDIDNGRFNTTSEIVTGALPKSSIPHKEKHDSTTHILITPDEVQFRSDCPNPQTYLETRNFITWLDSEIDFFTKNWSLLVPKDLGGYAPRFDKKDLLINGVPDIDGVADLRFQITQEKAFQIIEGSNIYKDRFVFIREIIQNAMDASKIQLWHDITSGVYKAWMNGLNYENIQPYEIDTNIYKNYPIKIKLSTLDNGKTQIIITDRGTGISIDDFKQMCNVGVSNKNICNSKVLMKRIPNWLKPTGSFGVGLQSIFLLTDEFIINTNTSNDSYHAVVHSNRTGGYLQLQRQINEIDRGTIIIIEFYMPDQFSYSMIGETNNYLSQQFDPMNLIDHTGEARVLESIKLSNIDSIFPIQIECAEKSLESTEIFEPLPFYINKNVLNLNGNNRYIGELSDDLCNIHIWDKEKFTYGILKMVPRNYSSIRIKYKGINVEKSPRVIYEGLEINIDIFDMVTKEVITLDRSSLTQFGTQKVNDIISEMFKLYIECVLEQINKNQEHINKKFDIYTFWLMCTPSQRNLIPISLIKQITNEIEIIKITDKKAEFNKIPAKELLLNNVFNFINLYNYEIFSMTRSSTDKHDFPQIFCILNSMNTDINVDIIIDEELTDAISMSKWYSFYYPVLSENLILYSIKREESPLISVESQTKFNLLNGLSSLIKGMKYNYGSNLAKRYAIPAITEFPDLALKNTPYGIAKPFGSFMYIISPFNRDDLDKITYMSKDEFITYILSLPEFNRLSNYVLENSEVETITLSKIVDSYKRLMNEYYDSTAQIDIKQQSQT